MDAATAWQSFNRALTFSNALGLLFADVSQHCVSFPFLLSEPCVEVRVVAVSGKRLLGFMDSILQSFFLQLLLSQSVTHTHTSV